jgi:hypothetical protein
LSPKGAAEYEIEIFRSIWRYRFFFNDLVDLLGASPTLAKQYVGFQEWVIDTIDGLLRQLIGNGDMRSIVSPNKTVLVAMNMWMLWLS